MSLKRLSIAVHGCIAFDSITSRQRVRARSSVWAACVAIVASLLSVSGALALTVAPDPTLFAESSKWRRVALARAADAAVLIDDPYRRAESFAAIARAYLLVGDGSSDATHEDEPEVAQLNARREATRAIEQALAAAEQVTEPEFRGWAMHEIVLTQIAADDSIGARQTAERIVAQRPHGAALTAIAQMQMRGGDLQAAQATAIKMRDRGAKSDVLRQIVAIRCARGEIEAARPHLRDIADPYYLMMASADIAVAQVRKGDITGANATAARVRRADRDEIFGRIALALVERDDEAAARQALQKIADPLHRATVQGRIALRQAEAGDTARARQRLAGAIADVQPSVQQLIKEKARSTERRLSEAAHRRASTIAQLARLQAAIGDHGAAVDTLQHVSEEAGYLSAGRARDDVLEHIARTQARVGDTASAMRAALAVEDRIARALLVRDIMVQVDATQRAAAVAKVSESVDPLIETAAHFGVLSAQLLKASPSLARESIDAAQTSVRKIEDQELKPAAFAALAAARVQAGDLDGSQATFQEALSSVDSLPRPNLRAAAYVRIVNSLSDRLMFLGRPSCATPCLQ